MSNVRCSRPGPIAGSRQSLRRQAWAMLGAILIAGSAGAACSARSGPALNTPIELYTSEGCSSCPPADRWLSSLAGNANFVPLAFHVDYWDHLGWRDRFASAVFTLRQKGHGRTSGARFLYTPQVVAGGRDLRRWADPATLAALERSPPAGADLTLAATPMADGGLSYRLLAQVRSSVRRDERVIAYLAVYENGLASRVARGENAGRLLTHDFVVRDWLGPFILDSAGHLDIRGEWRRPGVDLARSGLAAIVEAPDSGRVLQSLSLPFAAASCTS